MADKSSNTNVESTTMYTPVQLRATNAYAHVAVNARVSVATPHELIDMLYDGLLETLAQAKGAMTRGDIPGKGKCLTKAVRLLEEGLKAALSPMGGDLSDNLGRLYDYCIVRLTQANIRNDIDLLDEVVRLIEPVASGWKAIAPQANASREA